MRGMHAPSVVEGPRASPRGVRGWWRGEPPLNQREYFCTAWRSRIASSTPTARPATTHTALGTYDRALNRRGIASRTRVEHVAHHAGSDRHRRRTLIRDRLLGSAADVQPRVRPTREHVRLWRERPTDGARANPISVRSRCDLGAISPSPPAPETSSPRCYGRDSASKCCRTYRTPPQARSHATPHAASLAPLRSTIRGRAPVAV